MSKKQFRPETTSEHLARDMREGRFPKKSTVQMVPVEAPAHAEPVAWYWTCGNDLELTLLRDGEYGKRLKAGGFTEVPLYRLEAALREIAGIKEREKNCYPPDWREQIAACPECQRYKDHPIQRGICDDHRKPIYAQEDHNRHETKILGYRAMDIASAALEDGE